MSPSKLIFAAPAFVFLAGTAEAGLHICNETDYVQSVSIGYDVGSGWVSEGWWNVDPGECATVVGGDLTTRYYYYRAEVDGGDFSGEGYMFCTTPEEYTIEGDSDCEARGYAEESFREIDTGDTATDFTYTLVSESGGAPRSGDETADTGDEGLEICNGTDDVQSVAIGYENDEGFLSEGWWNIDPDDCALVLSGELQRQYYYFRAEVDGGEFEGEGYMFCTTSEVFTIYGDENCSARGYDEESFSEIDTGPTARGYTYYISAEGGRGAPSGGSAPTPSPEGAGLEICNDTSDIQAISVGYNGADDWTSEGWWNVDPGGCVSPALDGVNRRYFYLRAEVDGGEFDGDGYYFCTTPEAYEIVGDTECEARGYARESFIEIDTGSDSGEYTYTLSADRSPSMSEPETSRTPFPDTETAAPPTFDFEVPSGSGAEPEAATDMPASEPETAAPDLPIPPAATQPDSETGTTTRRGGSRGN